MIDQISYTKLNNIPKFVINLDRRPDRLESVSREMEYIGWSFERFSAIDTNSYIGCALSHKILAQTILERKYEYAMVFEDDIFFMPYAKQLLQSIEIALFESELKWNIFHFAPSIHRPLNRYNDKLLDLTHLPSKDESKHRGIYGTSGFILTPQACEYIIEWNSNKFLENSHQQIPIDQYYDMVIYPNLPSFCGVFPIVVQKTDFSDINKTYDSNHYIMTYNWNIYCPDKLDQRMFSYDFCDQMRNEH